MLDSLFDRVAVLSFTKVGYKLRKKLQKWDDEILEEIAGKHIAITGPTSGLGLTTAHQLAERGAKLVLLARNPEKMAKLAKEIQDKYVNQYEPESNPIAATITLDLADLASVRKAGKEIGELPKLDCLIHNGGGLHDTRQETGDGIELTLATHVVAPFALNQLVLPTLRKGTEPRIITITSGGQYTQKIDLEDLQTEQNYTGSKAYARAKRCQVDLTQHWAERQKNNTGNKKEITAHTMHPGWAKTEGLRESLPKFYKVLKPALRTPEQGVDTAIWLCAAKNETIGSGNLWHDRKVRSNAYLPGTGTSKQDQAKLWDLISQLAETQQPH